MKKAKRRRTLLVHKRYQLTQAGVVVLANLLTLLLVAVLASWYYLIVFNTRLVVSHNQTFPLLLAGCSLAVLLFSIWWSLRSSQRVAGQIRKLAHTLEVAARGEFPGAPLIFREDDYFPCLSEPLNNCLRQMRRQQEELLAARQAAGETGGSRAVGSHAPQSSVSDVVQLRPGAAVGRVGCANG